MSFLLDAIRRAEKQRNEDTVPSLEAIVSERRQRSKNRQGGWLIWVALVMVIAATVYLNRNYLSTWWQKTTEVSERGLTSVKNSLGNLISIEISDSDSGSDSGVDSKQEDTDKPSGSGQPATESSGSQLTDAQRALLSQIEFSVISYSSDPDKRFAMVGSEILREGDRLEGFPIKRIQADGVVISVSGKSVLIRP